MFRRLLRDFLSLSRGERRGLRLLGTLLLLLALARSIMPHIVRPAFEPSEEVLAHFQAFRDSIEAGRMQSTAVHTGYGQREITEGSPAFGDASLPGGTDMSGRPSALEPFDFDPNKASYRELRSLGLSGKLSNTLLNYREAGGIFRQAEDILRVYGFDSTDYSRLEAFIRIDTLYAGPSLQREFPEPERFELNTADSVRLLSVPGIGPVFARRILRYRDWLGGFHSEGQLLEVYGLSTLQHRELLQRCYIDTGALVRLDLNKDPVSRFDRHPYLDRYQAEALVRYRELSGSYSDVNEVLRNLLIPDTVFLKLRPYLYAGPPSPASQGLQDF
jgi:DNA uptake protein ComE-like DNA-binding protein